MRLRRCVPLALALAAFAAPTSGQVASQRAVISAWPSTTNYLAFAEFDAAQSGQIRITAGGAYTLYLNGDLVGADDDVSTVETWDVEFSRRTNEVAVVVEHDGVDPRYGLFCSLDSEEGPFVSSPLSRITPWFWSGDGLINEAGEDWLELRINNLPDHKENGVDITWSPVQAGTLDPTDFAEFADLDLSRARSVAGFPGGLDGTGGNLQLRTLAGLNLAFESLSQDPNIVDGDVSSAKTFSRGATALFNFIETDLGRLVSIDEVRVLTRPPRSGSFADNSLRGYSVLVSKDGVNFIEVGARNRITDFRETSVVFPAISARHVRVVVTEFSDRDASPQVGEVEVFGKGLDPVGVFRSQPLTLGTEQAKNFGEATWFSEVPRNGELALRFRSGDDGQTWSPWSMWSTASGAALSVPEPARLLQFEARMSTLSLNASPRLDSLVVTFDDGNLPAERAAASIAPVAVPIGVDTAFVYTVDITVGTGTGVQRLTMLTPFPATLDVTGIQGLGASTVDVAATYTTNDSVVISFAPPISEDTELTIPFTTRLLAASHDFVSELFAPGSLNPARTSVRVGEDPDSSLPLSRVVEATTFDVAVLSSVGAVPAVLTPNGDAINDQSVIGFVLGRVTSADVSVEIRDLGGRLVRTIDAGAMRAGSYVPVSGTERVPNAWDGTDDAGDLVPPGTYVFRIVVALEPEDAVAMGIIAVAY